jgi:phosphoglycolate phosphatase-like HAD superfamily hydrolase
MSPDLRMHGIELVVFDMAGTRVQDDGQVPAAFAAALTEFGVAVTSDTLDLQAGRNAGVRFNIGVLCGAHDRDVLAAEPHTHLLASVADLPALLAALEPGAEVDGVA